MVWIKTLYKNIEFNLKSPLNYDLWDLKYNVPYFTYLVLNLEYVECNLSYLPFSKRYDMLGGE